MPETRLCPECGTEVPANSPAGLCPRCVMKLALESPSVESPAHEPTQLSPQGPSAGFVPPTPAELAGRFPQLDILELLGRGGMGAVYKARQRGLDRLVAIKILPPGVGHDAAFAERFTREARSLARLNHPNIVGVYDFGQTDGLYYFAMEFVDGVNLRQAIASGSVQAKDALAIVPQICDALQFAHNEGIVHRDIKPENSLIDKKGRVKIADFGLAKLLGQEHSPDSSLTHTHQVMGTIRYMAPEQMEGSREVDHRADIYSLGVVFYEMLTGELPLGRFAPPSERVQIDIRLDEVVLRSLAKEPQRRYQQASEVKTDVENITRTIPSPASAGSTSAGIPDAAERERIRLLLQSPAQALGFSALIGFALSMLPLIILFVASDFGTNPGLRPGTSPWIVIAALTMPISATIGLLINWSLLKVQGYGLAVTVCILAMLPIHLGWLIGLPAGIFGLLVLRRTDVKAAFSAGNPVTTVGVARIEPATTFKAAPVPEDFEEARAQVRGPAIGLLVTGIIHCAFVLLMLIGVLVLGYGYLYNRTKTTNHDGFSRERVGPLAPEVSRESFKPSN